MVVVSVKWHGQRFCFPDRADYVDILQVIAGFLNFVTSPNNGNARMRQCVNTSTVVV